MELSVIIPVYNEEKTLAAIVKDVMSVPMEKQIILVDDCSTDRSRELMASLEGDSVNKIVKLHHEVNRGKGAALRHSSRCKAQGSL